MGEKQVGQEEKEQEISLWQFPSHTPPSPSSCPGGGAGTRKSGAAPAPAASACAFENMERMCKDMPRGAAHGPYRPCGQPGECAWFACEGPWTRVQKCAISLASSLAPVRGGRRGRASLAPRVESGVNWYPGCGAQ